MKLASTIFIALGLGAAATSSNLRAGITDEAARQLRKKKSGTKKTSTAKKMYYFLENIAMSPIDVVTGGCEYCIPESYYDSISNSTRLLKRKKKKGSSSIKMCPKRCSVTHAHAISQGTGNTDTSAVTSDDDVANDGDDIVEVEAEYEAEDGEAEEVEEAVDEADYYTSYSSLYDDAVDKGELNQYYDYNGQSSIESAQAQFQQQPSTAEVLIWPIVAAVVLVGVVATALLVAKSVKKRNDEGEFDEHKRSIGEFYDGHLKNEKVHNFFSGKIAALKESLMNEGERDERKKSEMKKSVGKFAFLGKKKPMTTMDPTPIYVPSEIPDCDIKIMYVES